MDRLTSRLRRKPEVIILGSDYTSERWALRNRCVLTRMPAAHSKGDDSAYTARNKIACARAHVLAVFWDGRNVEYQKLIDMAKRRGVDVRSFVFRKPKKRKHLVINKYRFKPQ